jgi:hypothetical protein
MQAYLLTHSSCLLESAPCIFLGAIFTIIRISLSPSLFSSLKTHKSATRVLSIEKIKGFSSLLLFISFSFTHRRKLVILKKKELKKKEREAQFTNLRIPQYT